jgi:hypothetical protein
VNKTGEAAYLDSLPQQSSVTVKEQAYVKGLMLMMLLVTKLELLS